MIRTGSVLEKLARKVETTQNRVNRARQRVEDLREEYKTAHWSKQRDVAAKGFRAKKALERAEVEFQAAQLALKHEETRLSQPDSFLRFG